MFTPANKLLSKITSLVIKRFEDNAGGTFVQTCLRDPKPERQNQQASKHSSSEKESGEEDLDDEEEDSDSDEEKKLYEIIMKYRKQKGLSKVALSPKLIQTAQAELAANIDPGTAARLGIALAFIAAVLVYAGIVFEATPNSTLFIAM